MPDPTPPNVLLVTTDQQRFDTCGPFKPSFMRTPHFDQLCREGVCFGRAYADRPVCVPSRMQIMTGKTIFNHRMWGNGRTSNLLGVEGTLPTRMHELGYHTIAVGKMHFGPQRARHGFDEMILPEDYYRWMRRSGYPYQPMRHGLGQCELEPGLATVPESLTLTSWIAEQSLEYILERRDPTRPFFMWTSFSKPHPPFDPPEPYYSMYRHCDIPDPVIGDWAAGDQWPVAYAHAMVGNSYDLLTPEVLREARAAYYGLITQIDYNLGRVLAALREAGQLDNTLIIYTSDHGECLGDHRGGGKGFFHEVSAHVPFALRMPKTWDDRRYGVIDHRPVCLCDILPTIVAAGGGRVGDDVDGMDLVRLARHEIDPRRYLEGFAGRDEHIDQAAITDGRWKYYYWAAGGVEHLFDLETDPYECTNLAADPACSQKKQELRTELVRRYADRAWPVVSDGDFIARPAEPLDEPAARDARWMGLHTDYDQVDVRH